jgi:hypothetical protein
VGVREVLQLLNGLDVHSVPQAPKLLELLRHIVADDVARACSTDQQLHFRVSIQSAADDITLDARHYSRSFAGIHRR